MRPTIIFALLLATAAVNLSAQEPYKEMLADELVFTGTESLETDPAEPIVIGLFSPDDDNHPVGRALTRGAELAVAEANASGGIGGRPIRLVRRWADDPWGAGSKMVIRLVFEDRAIALIGGPDGASTHVAQQVATKAHLPLIAPVSSDPSLTHTRVPWIFRLPPDDIAQARVLIEEGIAPHGLGRIGLVTGTDHDSRTAATELVAALEHSGRPPVFHLEIDPDDADLEAVARRASSFNPDGLILRLPPSGTRRIAAALADAGLAVPLFIPWIPGLDIEQFPLPGDGPVISIAPFATPERCGPYLKLVRAHIRRWGEKPSPATVYGYDAVNLVVAAARGGSDGRSDLRKAIAGTSLTGASGAIDWDTGGGSQAATPVLSTR